jgi:hypothetical protein
MAGMWYISDHDAENVAYLYGNLIDDLVEYQDWDFDKEIDWVTDDPKTLILLTEAWAILADEIEGEFTEDHQEVIDQTQKEEWVLRKGEHVMKLSYSEGSILSTSEDFPMDVIERIKQESPCYKTVDSGN